MKICSICNKKFTKNGVVNNEITICNKCIERIVKQTKEIMLEETKEIMMEEKGN